MRGLGAIRSPFYAADDPAGLLPPTPGPAPEPTPARDKPLTCEFCECKLTPKGDAMHISDKARTYRDGAEKIARLEKQVTKLEDELATAKRELAAANEKKEAGFFR